MIRAFRYAVGGLALATSIYLAAEGVRGNINYEATFSRNSWSMNDLLDVVAGGVFVFSCVGFRASFFRESEQFTPRPRLIGNNNSGTPSPKIHHSSPSPTNSGRPSGSSGSSNTYEGEGRRVLTAEL